MKITSLILISILILSFNLKDSFGKYEYRNRHVYESIELLDNHAFIYKLQQEFLNYTIKGNYHLLGDSLVLDSSPQKDKIIVREEIRGKFENKTFYVTDKRGDLITFHLYVTFNNGSEKTFKDCFEKVKFKSKSIKSFYVINTSGITSPEYKIDGKNTNTFNIQFETTRVFDNEHWVLKENKIIPRGVNGKLQDYFLTKN